MSTAGIHRSYSSSRQSRPFQRQQSPQKRKQQQGHLRGVVAMTLFLVACYRQPIAITAFSVSSSPRPVDARLDRSSAALPLPTLYYYYSMRAPWYRLLTGTCTRLSVLSSTDSTTEDTAGAGADVFDPESLLGADGIYNIETKEQHRAFLKENNDKIVVLKVYAPWCRACKGLEPKYQQIANSKDYEDMPAVQFTSMSIQNNKDYIKSIGVLALPTVQLYKHGKLVDNFPCGPSKVPILKKKLSELVDTSVDETTGKLKAPSDVVAAQLNEELVTEKPEGISPIKAGSSETGADEAEYLSQVQIRDIKTSVPFFEPLSESDYKAALQKAKILTFDTGAIIMREGNFGNSFYVMLKGEVEICQRTAFEDPLIAPTDYIGTVINRLTAGDWFGERALITGEPRAASIRVTEPMRALAFQKEDLPADCVLSGIPATIANNTIIGPDGQRSAIVDSVNEKYGVSMKELDEMETKRQIRESIFVNQKRGSVNKPKDIPGVDTDEDLEEDESEEPMMEDPSLLSLREKSAAIIPLLEKFKLIQLVSKCFDYIVKNQAQWGDPAIRRRRLLLVNSLPRSQREEFIEAFRLVDANKDGGISMSELKQVMETIGEDKSADDLNELIPHRGQTNPGGEDIMTLEDFMGIMAEYEFYYLFRDVFASLDTRGEGFVKAADLDRVLCGVRDLISDDRHSIIDVEDKDMSIDYEQFTRMLLGLSLSP